MKFTLSWLKDYLDTDAPLYAISDTLTSVGLEVEQITDNAKALEAFVVAEIISAEPHPNADKLRVCQVNNGSVTRQIVCGAANARAGIKVVLAREGVKIPANGLVIKKTTIRNVESNGMLCSATELGIEHLVGDNAGIIELPATAKLGERIAESLGLNDAGIEIAITPNRADCLGVRGIARDLAAAGLGTLKPLAKPAIAFSGTSPLKVTLKTEKCPVFVGCYIKNVKNVQSPDWLQQRLKAVGLKPISALVDITNYINVSFARPLHVFDADKINGTITVRMAKADESFSALNDKQYSLDSDMISVCDEQGVIGLAGVMGGKETGCSEHTKNVFLESALFDAVAIAHAGRSLAIDSDARYRFERGIDPVFVQEGAELAVAMILELCGGEASELVIAGEMLEEKRSIPLDYQKITSLGGVEIAPQQVDSILTSLGFTINNHKVIPPSWRQDIQGEADLVEEVLRIYGYDKIPSLPLPEMEQNITVNRKRKRENQLRNALVSQGLTELCSWAFVSAQQAKIFHTVGNPIHLLNPISVLLDTMRPNLLPHLLLTIANNNDRGFASLALFEMGNIFENITPEGQKSSIVAVRSHQAVARNPLDASREVDLFDAKSDLYSLLQVAGLTPEKLQVDRKVPSWYHPVRSGRISLGGKVTLGYFGELHPLVLAEYGINYKVVAAEMMLDAVPLPKPKSKAKPLFSVSNFQAVVRDFAFMADAKIESSTIIKQIESSEKLLIKDVQLFDLYQGKGVEEGKKSIAVSVKLQADDRTLSEQEIKAICENIIASVAGLGLVLR